MTTNHQILLEILQNHKGKDKAIKIKDLLIKVNYNLNGNKISERKLREIKAELNVLYGQYICSSHQYGYWIATTSEEIKQTKDFLYSYIEHISKEAKAIEQNFYNQTGIQLSLIGEGVR